MFARISLYFSHFSFFSSKHGVLANLRWCVIITSSFCCKSMSQFEMQHVSVLGEEIAEQSMPISSPRVVGAPTSLIENAGVMTNGNKCNSSVEIGAATNGENAKRFVRKETMRKIKSIGGHVGLLITLMLYTAIGGLVSLETKTIVSKMIEVHSLR